MGRMNPVPVEATHGATAAAVAELHRREQMHPGRAAQQRRERCEQWLARFPQFEDTDGRPCPFAIEIALRAKDAMPDANETRLLATVYATWRRDMDRRST